LTRQLALAAIGAYQRYVSPHKGFCCAYRAHTGGASCSTLGARVIRRHGLFTGCVLLRRRLKRCGTVHRQFHRSESRPLAAQRGDCDLGGCDMPGDGCDAGDACDCGGCDWPQRNRSRIEPMRKKRGEPAGSRWDELADSDRSRRRDS